MTMLYTPPQKLYLPSDDQSYNQDPPSSSDKEATANNKHVLYKQISPRRKFDKFGIDKTDYKSYVLSSTVYPTAVKTTLLAELQESNPHKCGFDVVERPKAELAISLTSKASSVLNAPPPTAEQSHRGPSSTHSAPIVAFVEVPSSEMPGTRRTSVNSKSTATSVVCSDLNEPENDAFADGNGNNTSNNNGDTRREENRDTDDVGDDVTKRTGIVPGEGDEGQVLVEQSRDVADNKPASVKLMQHRLMREKQVKQRRNNENRQDKPKVVSYSQLDNRRLIRYQWQSRESRTAEERKDGGDIRDPMYLNTFFPEERPVRFNKISLPRLTRSSRPRPWTVGESTISNRTALLIANRRSFPSTGVFADRNGTTSNSNAFQRSSWNANKSDFAGLPNVRRSSSVYKVDVGHPDATEDGRDAHNAWDEDTQEGMPLLEIRSCLANGVVIDQREKLKGRDGCLNSRVKQCVRFVRYRERLDRKDAENRPMKSEGGRYRPFSKTDVRSHNIVNPPPTPEQKLQQSVETYQKYIENIARQTNLSTPKHFSFRGHSTNSSRPTHASLTAASSIIDADSLIVQSVMNSNQPEMTLTFQTRTPSETPRPQNSAIYTKDVRGVGDVLDIKRLSPKISTNRIVPGTRVAHEKPLSPTPRFPSASTDEGVDMVDTAPPTSRGDAIVVPMGSKSECPSEYSVSKED